MGSDRPILITAAIFSAYLKCPTKAFLLAGHQEPTSTFFADLSGNVSSTYKRTFGSILVAEFSELSDRSQPRSVRYVDSETAFYIACEVTPDDDQPPRRSAFRCCCLPIFYSAWSKPIESDQLMLSFCALAIRQKTGSPVPQCARIVYGPAGRNKDIQLAGLLPKAQLLIEKIVKDRTSDKPPPLVLNKHCSVCDFQSRCRTIAANEEHLSLLTGMSRKERAKCADKGITTITQLSYNYRPRRRKSAKSTGSRRVVVKHDHKLQALAIKKAQVHVVGSPVLSIDGTPVFIDVEGVDDQYYLIGLRYRMNGVLVESSFWADQPEDESRIWQECLQTLKLIERPRLIHYGAYESRFLKQMRLRWNVTGEDAVFLDRLIDGSTNLITNIYGKIYFPTYSNGLKEVARSLGFAWTWSQASGAGAMLLRRHWELTLDERSHRQLIDYNTEDCRAAELVYDAINVICGNDVPSAVKLEPVNVTSLEVGFQRTFGKFAGAVADFEKINSAAYWDYQRTKVYVRTDKLARRRLQKATRSIKKISVEKEVAIDDRPKVCPKCGCSKIWIAVRVSYVIFDLKFTRRGIKRWAVRYHYNNFKCGACKAQMTPHMAESKYGPQLRAYIVYLMIEMRLSHQKIQEHIATVFEIPILSTMINTIKIDMARKYEPTYRAILSQIANGGVVHADETKGVVYGGGHYIWVFANLTEVAYVYSATREASTMTDILSSFDGVLVSDFYSGYDSLPCKQQKCLIHLMRDINEDLLKQPFNDELSFIAKRFGTLLREIVETVDRYGLRTFHLKKHRRSVELFLDDVAGLNCLTEPGAALRKRIEKNKDKLFTFLDHDGVPWNNNNAEHAVRAFTRLRNGMSTSTPKGTTDYCILLSLQQTLYYRGNDFLEFLKSGRIEVDPT